MSYRSLLARDAGASGTRALARLIVTRQDPQSRAYHAIGYLDRVENGYEYVYIARAVAQPAFLPMVGFRDTHRRYHRAQLFPSFAERVISAKRPDRPEYLRGLSLEQNADAWEILSASGGYRQGDAIELISLPTFEASTGRTTAAFLAHGVRHRGEEASRHIEMLRPGDSLGLEPHPDNEVNPRAIRVVDGTLHLGYVPDPLLDYVWSLELGAVLTVVQANSAETNPHLRLLLRLEGTCRGPFVFDGPEWAPAA